VTFAFPPNVGLPPGGRLVVVSFDPLKHPRTLATFVSKYGLPSNEPVFGPWTGALNNGGETIALTCPDTPRVVGAITEAPYYLIEAVSYQNTNPWPTNADGTGASMQRI